jgi:adenylate cyclase
MLELVFEDSGVSHRIPVRDGLTLGRSSDNDVVLRDFSVSRHHARIEEKDGELHLVDLESTNGVRVNEEFVASGAFALGDLLGVGSFELRVEEAASDTGGLSSATYLRPLSEFNQDYGLEGQPQEISKEIGRRERVFEILAQVAKVLIQVEELDPVLEKVMDLVEDAEVPISRTILDMVSQQQVAILTHDAQADQRFEAGRSVRIHQIRSAMCAPLWHRERVIGVIYVDSPLHVGSFSASDLDLLTALSNYAAVAIERARLNENIRRERQARDRLERYHSPAVIEAVLSDSGDDRATVTVRETSILFADIVGFTARCETLPPEDVAAFLNQFFSLAADVIFKHGGTLDKFIGDAVMAFFGAPLPQDDHAERAVRSALELLTVLDEWNSEREAAGDDRIEVRVAVNSGPVVVGDIGSATRVDYTVLGNTVNVTSRLEEHVAEPGTIVLGESTQAAVADLFPTEPLGSVQLKGLSRKINIFRVATEEIEKIEAKN